MSTSHNKYDALENLIFQEGLKIQSLEFNQNYSKMFVHLTNAATFVVPTNHYKGLQRATAEQLKNFRLIGSGTGIHWSDLDEDLSLKGFLNELLRKIIKQQEEFILA
jgi:hypothetical protein